MSEVNRPTHFEQIESSHPLRSTDDVKLLEKRVELLEKILREFLVSIRAKYDSPFNSQVYDVVTKYKDFFDGKY